MHSPNKRRMTDTERDHVGKVKAMPCACCGAVGPSEAHEIEQGLWFLSIPLCASCHRGSLGLHGTKAHMNVRKLTELTMLDSTIRDLLT